AELLDSFVKSAMRLSSFGLADGPLTGAPELLDCFNAPKGALAGSADWPAIHQHVDRISVQLRKMSQRDPRALRNFDVEIQIVHFSICWDIFRRRDFAIDDNFDNALASLHEFIVARRM